MKNNDQTQVKVYGCSLSKLGISEFEYKKPSQYPYVVLIDKGAGDFIMTCINEGRDGVFAYKKVHRLFRETAGLGTLERRNYILNPAVAKKEEDVYGTILKWERSIKEEEKQSYGTEIINEKLRIGVLRKICCGSIKNYLETHESIVSS